MEIHKGDYFLGCWIGDTVDLSSNFLMTVWKRGERWMMEYRFRYVVDDKNWEESKDRKSFYSGSMSGEYTDEEMVKKMQPFIELVRLQYPNVRFIEVHGDDDKLQYVLAQQPEMQVRTGKAAEETLRKMGGDVSREKN